MVSARDICEDMGYRRWENFNALVRKAIQLINSGAERGTIVETKRVVKIGCGTNRFIVDFELDADAVDILNRISSNKQNKSIRTRNEAVILSMLEKYCKLKSIPFDFQFELNGYKYDCIVNKEILIEFDEQHHSRQRQKNIDEKKNLSAERGGYKMIRFDISNDIIDIICAVDKHISNKKIEPPYRADQKEDAE